MARDASKTRSLVPTRADKNDAALVRKDRQALEKLRLKLYDRLGKPGELDWWWEKARELADDVAGKFIDLLQSQAYLEADKMGREQMVRTFDQASRGRSSSVEMVRFVLGRILPEYKGAEHGAGDAAPAKAAPFVVNFAGRGTLQARETFVRKNAEGQLERGVREITVGEDDAGRGEGLPAASVGDPVP